MNICINKNEELNLDFIVEFLKNWDDIDYPITLKVRDETIVAEQVNGNRAAELICKIGAASSSNDLTILINLETSQIAETAPNAVERKSLNMKGKSDLTKSNDSHKDIESILKVASKKLKESGVNISDENLDNFFKEIGLWPLKRLDEMRIAFRCAIEAENVHTFSDIVSIAQLYPNAKLDKNHIRKDFEVFLSNHPKVNTNTGKRGVSIVEVFKVFNKLMKE